MSQSEVYRTAGFGRSVRRGTRPAIVVVDFSFGFTDVRYPTAAEMSAQMKATARVAEVAREKGFRVIYTTIAYDSSELDMFPWLDKSTGMKTLVRGSRMVEINPMAGIREVDLLIEKKGPSAFFGTYLAAFLTGACVDTVVVAGATTSGCVRATVVDAVQSGFNTLVPADCCADRASAPHDANLYDMDQKYADVTDSDNIIAWMKAL